MVSQAQAQNRMSVEDYLKLEKETGIRYEYIDGEVYAMSGGTARHSRIITNFGGFLFPQLRPSNCYLYDSNMKVQINLRRYVYPDLTVVCGKSLFADKNETLLTNPTLVMEVVSPSSEARDFFIKLELYRSVASVQTYVIVEQDRPHITLYTRQGETWILQDIRGLEATLPLEAIGAKLKLADIYDSLTFEDDDLI